jgi:uncharacterized protein DUF6221
MVTLAEFLLARIAEDEAAARAATEGHWVPGVKRAGEPGRWRGIEAYSVLADRTEFYIPDHDAVADSESKADVEHISRWDPARVLAECEAKRRIVEGCIGIIEDRDGYFAMLDVPEVPAIAESHLRLLALPYADRPDYREEWRATTRQ